MFLQASLFVLSLVAFVQGTPRILGGYDAPNHKYPYQISFRDENGHFCSGSILNERWILTAAHCFADRQLNFKIHAGTNYLSERGTVYKPESVVIHERYTNYRNYDIAMIRLKTDIVYNDFIKPISPLPSDDPKEYGKNAHFAGWGSTELSGPKSDALQELDFHILTYEECKNVLNLINKRHICTLNRGGQGMCHGDAGGPLVVDGVQVGIASWMEPCALNYPDVYTRVFSYKSWIARNLAK